MENITLIAAVYIFPLCLCDYFIFNLYVYNSTKFYGNVIKEDMVKEGQQKEQVVMVGYIYTPCSGAMASVL